MGIELQNNAFLETMEAPSELTSFSGMAVANEEIAPSGCFGSFGTLGSATGCAGSFGTYGCGGS